MSGPLPKQQKSRSPKGKDLDVITKEEAVEIAKEIDVEKVAESSLFERARSTFGFDGIEPDDTTDQNGDGSSDDEGEEDDG